MSRIGFVADCHLDNHRIHGGPIVNGINTRCRQALDTFRAAITAAKAAGCTTYVVNGDLFDSAHPSPQLLAEVQDALAAAAPMKVILLVGNHDQHTSGPNDHALAPLREWATIIEKPTLVPYGDGVAIACMPFLPQPAANWFVPAVEALCSNQPSADVLAVHLGISDSSTPPWLQGSKDAISVDTVRAACAASGLRAAFAGNWHNRQLWEPEGGGPFVIQCGALVPTGWDNEGLEGYGGLVVFDAATGGAVVHDIPGPRFVKVKNEAELKKAERAAKLAKCHLYARLAVDPGDMPAALELVEAATKRGLVLDVVLDSAQSEAQAAAAAHAARGADTLEEAVAAYVGQMELEEDVDRKLVAERTLEFLR